MWESYHGHPCTIYYLQSSNNIKKLFTVGYEQNKLFLVNWFNYQIGQQNEKLVRRIDPLWLPQKKTNKNYT